MKNFILSVLAVIGTLVPATAQYAVSLSNACASATEVNVKINLQCNQSELGVCGYTVELLDMNGVKIATLDIAKKPPLVGNNSSCEFNYNGKIPAGVNLKFPCKIKVTANRNTSATIDAYQYCGAVRFKNRWKSNDYINVENGLSASPIQPAFLSGQWELIPVSGTKFFQIKSVWKLDTFLNIEKGPLEASNVPAAFWSGHWELETVVGAEQFIRIKNRWKPDVYIHVENGKLEASAVSLSFQSANWTLQKSW